MGYSLVPKAEETTTKLISVHNVVERAKLPYSLLEPVEIAGAP